MRKPLSVLSATVAALAVATTVGAATPAQAATVSCRTTLSGGFVGGLVIASSSDVYAEAVDAPQRAVIDLVTVNTFGQKRYRLASPVKLVTAHGSTRTSFTGGAGSFVSEQSLRVTSAFSSCARRLQG